MARGNPQPWLREFKNRPPCWYVQVGGRQVRLCEDRGEAFRMYHEVVLRERAAQAAGKEAPPVADGVVSVGRAFEDFLAFVELNRARRTFQARRHYLRSFALFVGPGEPASFLTSAHVDRWRLAHPRWNPSTSHTAVVSVKHALRWAFEAKLLDANPLAHVRAPQGCRREAVLAAADYAELVEHCPEPGFRDLMAFCWETGCRPQEAITVEAKHIEPGGRFVTLPLAQSKSKRSRRVIPLSEAAAGLCRRLAAARPEGKLFRNARGAPFNSGSTSRAFHRIRRRRGRVLLRAEGWAPDEADVRRVAATYGLTHAKAAVKLRDAEAARRAPKHCLYEFRHTFATRALRAGIPVHAVAIAMGHRNPSMVLDVYQHLAQDREHLLDELKKLG